MHLTLQHSSGKWMSPSQSPCFNILTHCAHLALRVGPQQTHGALEEPRSCSMMSRWAASDSFGSYVKGVLARFKGGSQPLMQFACPGHKAACTTIHLLASLHLPMSPAPSVQALHLDAYMYSWPQLAQSSKASPQSQLKSAFFFIVLRCIFTVVMFT